MRYLFFVNPVGHVLPMGQVLPGSGIPGILRSKLQRKFQLVKMKNKIKILSVSSYMPSQSAYDVVCLESVFNFDHKCDTILKPFTNNTKSQLNPPVIELTTLR